MTDNSDRELLSRIREAALIAGQAIMDVYATDFAVEHKDDKSPVTAADRAAEDIILPVLKAITPTVTIISEESFNADSPPTVGDEPFWLVDPLDGTKQFITKQGEFTVNIALIRNRVPVLGVVHAPAVGRTYLGGPEGASLEVDGGPASPITVRSAPAKGITAVASRSHRTPETDAFLDNYDVGELISSGSSIKFCLVAEGKADLYPRFGPTMEWDTAAGHAVLNAAGGSVTHEDGSPFLYGKADFRNPNFIARGRDIA